MRNVVVLCLYGRVFRKISKIFSILKRPTQMIVVNFLPNALAPGKFFIVARVHRRARTKRQNGTNVFIYFRGLRSD